MSWDAWLVDPTDGEEWFVQNYTHNINGMIAEALTRAEYGPVWRTSGTLGKLIGPAWFDHLDGLTGAEAAEFLRKILVQFDADPAAFRAMNPPNGWGDFDSLRRVLSDMHTASAAHPDATWRTSG